MKILICIALFCLFIVFIYAFSTRYIQFVYKKLYLEPKQALDTITMYGSIPDGWVRAGKKSCLKRLKKLGKFVSQDRLTSQYEKEEQMEVLCEIKKEWEDKEPSFFVENRSS